MQELENLLVKEMSYDEAQIASGFSKSTSRHYIESLHDQGRVYISGWRVTRHASIKLFKAGNKPDAPRPRRIGDEEPEPVPFHVDIRRDWLQEAFFGDHRRAA